MREIWKTLIGNRQVYEISNLGNVRSIPKRHLGNSTVAYRTLNQTVNSSGYFRVSLNITGTHKSHFVHRLVAELFVENPENKPFVNHIDGDKRNNKSDNLEWCTRSENEKHAWRAGLKSKDTLGTKGEKHGCHKLTKEQVDYIRAFHIPYHSVFGSKPLGVKFGVSDQTITDIVHGRTWIETLPYHELITEEF